MNGETSKDDSTPGQRLLEWGALAGLLAAPLVGPVLLGGSRLWASGPLMGLTFLAAALVFARPLIWRAAGVPLRIPPGGLAWLGFLAYSAGAIWMCPTPYEARVELLRAASLWAAYWAWANLVDSSRRWRWVLGVVLLAGTLNALYGVINHFQGHPERVLWFDRTAEGSGGYADRISGTYFCPNHWASLLALLTPVALALVCTPGAGAFLRMLAGYALLLFPFAIHFSQSRAGWLGLAAGLAVTSLALMWRRSKAGLAVLLVALPLLLAGGAAGYWKYSPAFRTRFAAAFDEGRTGHGFRMDQWRDTLLMIRDQPWLGHGPGSYGWVAEAFRHHMNDSTHQAFYAHNDYLQSLAELGVVGTLLLALPLAWLLWNLLRSLHTSKNLNNIGLVAGLLGAWTAMLVHACFDFNLRIYGNVAVLALLSGLVVGRLELRRRDAAEVVPVATARALTWAVLLVAVALLCVTKWTLASYFLEVRAGQLVRAFNGDRAERWAQPAWRLDAGNWYAAETLGDICQFRARWGQDQQQRKMDAAGAVHWFDLAVRGNRSNMGSRYKLGLSLVDAGKVEEGLQHMRQAADNNPLNVEFCSQLGLQLRLMGRYAEALAEFRKAGAIQGSPMIDANLTWLEKQVAEERRKR